MFYETRQTLQQCCVPERASFTTLVNSQDRLVTLDLASLLSNSSELPLDRRLAFRYRHRK